MQDIPSGRLARLTKDGQFAIGHQPSAVNGQIIATTDFSILARCDAAIICRDIDDVRESPALDVSELLRQKGADVHYHDPYVPTIRHNRFEMAGEADLDAALRPFGRAQDRLGSGQAPGRGRLCGGGDGSFVV